MASLQQMFISKQQALKHFNGYTVLNGLLYVVRDNAKDETFDYILNDYPEVPKALKSKLIFGYEYGKGGEALGLPYGVMINELIKIFGPFKYELSKGGYIDEQGNSIEENNIIIDGSAFSDIDLAIKAERLRVLFRQECILFIDSTGECHFIKE